MNSHLKLTAAVTLDDSVEELIWSETRPHQQVKGRSKRIAAIAATHNIRDWTQHLRAPSGGCLNLFSLYRDFIVLHVKVLQVFVCSERNYSTADRELLAIVLAVKFRVYLAGQRFDRITDHRTLTWIHESLDLNECVWSARDGDGWNFCSNTHLTPFIGQESP